MKATYRYRLTRGPFMFGHGRLMWVMSNPSTADESVDDPTIRRVMSFTEAHGFQSLTVVNLFAARSTDPKGLALFDDPVGPENLETIRAEFALTDGLVFAWGASLTPRLATLRPPVEQMAEAAGLDPWCLGTTVAGNPLHPLYLRADTKFRPYVSRCDASAASV